MNADVTRTEIIMLLSKNVFFKSVDIEILIYNQSIFLR
jgi:hypothetical protein